MNDERAYQICLVADNNLFSRAVITRALGEYLEVIEAPTGDECLRLYETIRPDIALINYDLVELSADGLIEEILALDPEASLVIISGDSCDPDLRIARHNGATAYLSKPFKLESLLDYVKSCPAVVWTTGISHSNQISAM